MYRCRGKRMLNSAHGHVPDDPWLVLATTGQIQDSLLPLRYQGFGHERIVAAVLE